MRTEAVLKTANGIRKKYGGHVSPEELCRDYGIIVLKQSLGNCPGACKGFAISVCGRTAVTVNSDLEQEVMRMVLYHELGHYFLHIRTGMGEAFHDFLSEDMSAGMEYEANLFAAELMIEDTDAAAAASGDKSIYEAAAELRVVPELLAIKLHVMHERDGSIPDSPLAASACFLAG